ncbi:hypothetical protein LCGC14_2379010 [marine sediment metagenome]|uniref:Uncharacterized protein n=1 Tax=marine sediment metagenome TaxID=412755 RepID=A0A0F9C1L8_9ZZZZ
MVKTFCDLCDKQIINVKHNAARNLVEGSADIDVGRGHYRIITIRIQVGTGTDLGSGDLCYPCAMRAVRR